MSLIKRNLYEEDYALLEALFMTRDELDGNLATVLDVKQNLFTFSI